MRYRTMTYAKCRRNRKETSGGVAPAARVQPVKPCRLLALRLAFLVRWCRRRRPDVDRARLGRVDVLDVRVPAIGRRGDRRRGRSEERRVGKECRSGWWGVLLRDR